MNPHFLPIPLKRCLTPARLKVVLSSVSRPLLANKEEQLVPMEEAYYQNEWAIDNSMKLSAIADTLAAVSLQQLQDAARPSAETRIPRQASVSQLPGSVHQAAGGHVLPRQGSILADSFGPAFTTQRNVYRAPEPSSMEPDNASSAGTFNFKGRLLLGAETVSVKCTSMPSGFSESVIRQVVEAFFTKRGVLGMFNIAHPYLDGSFLLRQRQGSSYALSYLKGGKIIHLPIEEAVKAVSTSLNGYPLRCADACLGRLLHHPTGPEYAALCDP